MKVTILLFAIVIATTSVNAQTQKIDLANDPNQPAINLNRSNAQLLKDAKDAPAPIKDSSNIQNVKIATPVINTPNSSSQLDINGQPLNTQTNQINIGNKKATSTIHYDNSGKVRGNGTTIELGK